MNTPIDRQGDLNLDERWFDARGPRLAMLRAILPREYR
jgi:hypothetical protein